jgi:hypothetical protein
LLPPQEWVAIVEPTPCNSQADRADKLSPEMGLVLRASAKSHFSRSASARRCTGSRRLADLQPDPEPDDGVSTITVPVCVVIRRLTELLRRVL